MAESHVFDPTVLREYDIRGVVGETLNADDARAVGRAYATMVEEGARVCVGYDGRLSSPELEAAVVEGMTASGIQVLRIGLGPTPMLYFAVHHLAADGGLMVTGSHLPPDHNGFKMVLATMPLYGPGIRRLGEIAASGAYRSGAGRAVEAPVADAYVARLLEGYDGGRDLTAVWDAGNGAAGEVMARLTARLPGRHILINETVDGRFPAHHPDPTVAENLDQLKEVVLRDGCDLGIGLDGDGDRIGVLDGKGRILWADQVMAILVREVLREKPGATIIADVKASQVLFDEISRLGGSPLMWRTGHSLIKAKMAETGAPFAGEMSGHIFFADRYYGFDDALYAAVRLLGLLSRSGDSLAELRDRLPQLVNTPELRLACPEDRKFAVIDEVKTRLRETGAKLNDIDGVRVETADGWWLLRASNTQAVLVARCEAGTAAGLERLKRALIDQLERSGIAPGAL